MTAEEKLLAAEESAINDVAQCESDLHQACSPPRAGVGMTADEYALARSLLSQALTNLRNAQLARTLAARAVADYQIGELEHELEGVQTTLAITQGECTILRQDLAAWKQRL